MNWMDNGLPDKSVQLIIADPPYFEVKGDFDFVWPTFEAYLSDVERWAQECKRLLADNGTLFWWGHAKRIAYAQIIFDKYFALKNNLVWKKTDVQTRKSSPDNMRTFAPITERLLMYAQTDDNDKWLQEATGWEKVKLDVNHFTNLRKYFKELQNFIGVSKKTIIENIGQKADHCFRHSSTQFDLPTLETYNELEQTFQIKQWNKYREYEDLRREYEDLRREYEYLRREYEDLRRPFDNRGILQTDVLEYSQESHITKQYAHETKKPEGLTRALILTCSRPNDLVLVPFAGSGTECAMAAREGRRFIGFDIEEKYCTMANERAQRELMQPKLL